ncbi:amidase [Mesorhizobium sp.]|uniref:amidase n=1 Tax=Mesorhizobium sp. TaxID=1871066 RepID=UPI00121F0B2C|nr:amidase [Mesorhizobium sp.]TIO67753.1 MAG: amidase [Mesorhizobium sp.]
MNLQEYAELDAVALSMLVKSGEIPAIEVTEAAIAAIEALNPTLNALVLVDFDRARNRAKQMRRDARLAGVPFLIKDIGVYTEEWPTTLSSRFFADAKPKPDSEIVKRWRAAGTVFLGKTNTPEFAGELVTEPAFRAPTLNPWNLSLSVGGSSGGAAAAVASGMVPVAHGSDTGGSIRVPAACCGLFGFKPSRGLNPVGPYFSEVSGGMNSEHVLSISVRDSAAFLDATAGPEMGASYRVIPAVDSFLEAIKQPSGRLRIACLSRGFDGSRLAPEIEAGLGKAMTLLTELGHEVVLDEFPIAVAGAAMGDGWSALWMTEIVSAIQDRSKELGRPPGPQEIERLGDYVRKRVTDMNASDYVSAQRAAHRATLAMARQFDSFNMIITPTTATLPPEVGSIQANSPDFDYDSWAAMTYTYGPFTEIFNVTGQPAASVPLFQSASGMPIGIQIAGRRDEDHVVLRLASELEQATGWARRHPPNWAGRLSQTRLPAPTVIR